MHSKRKRNSKIKKERKILDTNRCTLYLTDVNRGQDYVNYAHFHQSTETGNWLLTSDAQTAIESSARPPAPMRVRWPFLIPHWHIYPICFCRNCANTELSRGYEEPQHMWHFIDRGPIWSKCSYCQRRVVWAISEHLRPIISPTVENSLRNRPLNLKNEKSENFEMLRNRNFNIFFQKKAFSSLFVWIRGYEHGFQCIT